MGDSKHAEVLALVQGALENPDDLASVTLPDGTELKIEREPEEGISLRVRASAEGAEYPEFTLWQAAPARPDSYPSTLPFIPDRAVSVTVVPSREAVSMRWSGVPDPKAVLAQLAAASKGEGWVPEESPASADTALTGMLALRRGERQRILIPIPTGSEAIVSLLEITV